MSATTEIDLYLAEADALKYGDHNRLLTVAQQASNRAQVIGDFYRYAQALTHQAWAYGNLNQYEASLTCSLEVMALARSHGFVDVEARAVGIVSLNFCRCGMGDEAAYLYEHQLKLGKQLQDRQIQAMALNDLALVKLGTHQEIAMDMLQQAAKLMPTHTHQGIDCATVQLNLAIAYINAKRFDAAVEHAQKVLALKAHAPRLISDAYLCMASIYLERGQLQEAKNAVEAARARIENAQPPIYNDNLEEMTAELLMFEKRYPEAVRVWEYMYEMAVQRQELDFAVTALNHIKDTYELMSDSAGIINAYKRLSEDIPRLQKQNHNLRFAVLRTVFAIDKAAMQAELNLTRQKNKILQRLSHEFRTPLAIIQNSADAVERYNGRMTLEQRQERLQGITSQVKWMTVMLDDILELLTLDENADPLAGQTAFSLEELSEAALFALERYHISDVRVHVQIQPDVGTVHGAPKSLETVLIHLLTNAIKFSKDQVYLNLWLDKNDLVLQVIDQGIGILPAEHEIVFQPLVRGSNLDEVTGTGLGLAIVARLVEQMHGIIKLDSSVNTGTSVTVRVPLSSTTQLE